jgi:hypothetical protein
MLMGLILRPHILSLSQTGLLGGNPFGASASQSASWGGVVRRRRLLGHLISADFGECIIAISGQSLPIFIQVVWSFLISARILMRRMESLRRRLQTTERYLGCKQNLGHPVNDLFNLRNDVQPPVNVRFLSGLPR